MSGPPDPGPAPSAPFRILVFLPCLTLGGAERQAVLVASYLKTRGHEIEVWGFPSPHGRATLVPELDRRGLAHAELPSWPTLGWDYARFGPFAPAARWWKWGRGLSALQRQLPPRRFDVVVPYTFWPSLAATLLRERLGVRRVFWNHRGGDDGAGILYSAFLVRKILDRRPDFVANSRAGATFLSRTFALPPGTVTIVPNAFLAGEGGTDPPVAVGAGRSASARGGVSEPLSLVHVANFYPEKDYDTLLEGMSLLKEGGTSFQLHVCGEFLHDSDRSRFASRVRDLGLQDKVVLHGAVPRAEVLSRLAQADVALLSSRSEGQPNAVMEAMHAGLPVVGTRIPGIQELVGEAGEEWLFDVGDARGLARAVARLGADPAQRAEIGARNRRRILEDYAPEKVLPRWAGLVEGAAP